MAQLKGETITLKSKGKTVTVSWKQGSFLGMGGDKSQNYWLYTYTRPTGTEIPVYIQAGYDVPSRMTIDSNLQYGMQEGVIFFVYHDKSQTPYQHRFRTNTLQKFAYAANELTKMMKGVDLSWLAGDYLRDV